MEIDKKHGKVTMKSLAAGLGVSPATVSLILKGKAREQRISRTTESRVLAEAKRLGYRPDYFAASLRGRSSGVVGVVLPDIFERFMGELVKGIEDQLYPDGVALMLSTCRFSHSLEERAVRELLHRRVDGLIVVPAVPFEPVRWRYPYLVEAARRVPLIIVDRIAEGVAAPTVLQADYQAAGEGASLLLAGGVRRPAAVSLDVAASSVRNRLAGFRDACRGAGIEPCKSLLLAEADPDATDLGDGLRRLVGGESGADGLFVTTRGVADKCAALLRSRGIEPGRDLPILRFGADDPYRPSGMLCRPQPHYEMGAAAARNLIALMGGGRAEETLIDYPPIEYGGINREGNLQEDA